MGKKLKKTVRTEIEKGYEELMGEEYVRLPKRDRENLYKRYKAIEEATIEYYRENKGRKRGKGV